MSKDPVCGMEVEEKDNQFMTHLEHETFYFCSKECQERFELEEGVRHGEPGRKWWQKIFKEFKGVSTKHH